MSAYGYSWFDEQRAKIRLQARQEDLAIELSEDPESCRGYMSLPLTARRAIDRIIELEKATK